MYFNTYIYNKMYSNTYTLPETTTWHCEESQQGQNHPEGQQRKHIEEGVQTEEEAECHQLKTGREGRNTFITTVFISFHFFSLSVGGVQCVHLLQFFGDAEACVDPLSALGVFGLVVF